MERTGPAQRKVPKHTGQRAGPEADGKRGPQRDRQPAGGEQAATGDDEPREHGTQQAGRGNQPETAGGCAAVPARRASGGAS